MPEPADEIAPGNLTCWLGVSAIANQFIDEQLSIERDVLDVSGAAYDDARQ